MMMNLLKVMTKMMMASREMKTRTIQVPKLVMLTTTNKTMTVEMWNQRSHPQFLLEDMALIPCMSLVQYPIAAPLFES